MKEFLRKTMVSLKRSPQNIAMVAMLGTFIFYSLNLTKISDTTAKIQGSNMGLCGFVTMLFSVLVFVTFLNSYPKRKKPNYPMIVITVLMYAAIIFADYTYRAAIARAYASQSDFADVVARNPYITKADNVCLVHMILSCVVVLLVLTRPLYGKLLRKVNTNIDLEYSGNMDAIEVSEE